MEVVTYTNFYILYFSGEEDEEADGDFGSASKKRRTARNVKTRKSTVYKYDATCTLFFHFSSATGMTF